MYSHVIAVTDRKLCRIPFLEQIGKVCALRPKALILREKDLDEAEYGKLASEVMAVCREYQVPLILHTFTGAAAEAGAECIHLPLWKLREMAGKPELQRFRVVGASVHSVQEAKEAEQLGAGYLTAGHIYATDCKKGLPPRGLTFLREVCGAVEIPVYGIGGIGLAEEQIKEVMQAGAAGACVMSGFMRTE